MISNLNQLDNSLIDEIKQKYIQDKRVDKLREEYHLDRNVIIAILANLVRVKDLSAAKINEDKFIIISDTHLASELEKLKYLEYVYNFASKYGIHNIVHAGDLMQSNIPPVMRKYQSDEKQLEYVTRVYPYDDAIKNHILFGNHDYNTLSKNDEYIKVLEARKDFNLMGFKKAYLNWCGYLIKFYHQIDDYKINIPSYEHVLFRVLGHSHSMVKKGENTFTVPSLSLDTKVTKNAISFPGFLMVEKNDEEIRIYHFVFRESIYKITDRIEVLIAQSKDKEAENIGIVFSHKLRDNRKK